MLNDRSRILELALESLENRKKQIDQEIAEIKREFRGGTNKKSTSAASAQTKTISSPRTSRKRSRFSKEEKLRRSERMKSYWDNWRKNKSREK